MFHFGFLIWGVKFWLLNQLIVSEGLILGKPCGKSSCFLLNRLVAGGLRNDILPSDLIKWQWKISFTLRFQWEHRLDKQTLTKNDGTSPFMIHHTTNEPFSRVM